MRHLRHLSFCILHSAFCIALATASVSASAGFVEYVQVAFSNPGDGQLPLSTGWNYTKTSRLWVDFALTSTADAMKQYRIAQSSDGYAAAYVNGSKQYAFNCSDDGLWQTTKKTITTTRYVTLMDNARNVWSMTNVTSGALFTSASVTSGKKDYTKNGVIYLGGNNSATAGGCRYYGFKGWDGDEQKVELIPCEVDGQPGFLDLLSGAYRFPTAIDGYTWTAGPAPAQAGGTLLVRDNLGEIGSPTPTYGASFIAQGTPVACSAPATVNMTGTNYVCNGYTLISYDFDTGKPTTNSSSSTSFTYTHSGYASLTWDWEFTGIDSHTTTFSCNDSSLGTISTTGGSYSVGDLVTVTAKAEYYSRFIGWTGNLPAGVDASSPQISFLADTSDHVLTANFERLGESAINVAALVQDDSGEGWTFDGTNLVLSTPRQYVAYGTRTEMSIRADADCTLVASNLSVSAVGLTKAGLDCNYHEVSLQLWSDNGFNNTFRGGTHGAGIAVVAASTEAALTISNLNETATLTATGGTSSGGTAGIGGGNQQKGGTIIIRGGTISATAGTPGGNTGGAGIGGGYGYGATAVIISGGTVTATPATCASGIGAGRNGSCGYVEISGGTVTAKGAAYAAGIGIGYTGKSSGPIVISGGNVTVPSGGAVGIGGGTANVRITGGTVTATGSSYGIGGGGGSIAIGGGRVTATGTAANSSTGIGGTSIAVAISGGTIKATGKYQGIGRTSTGTAGTVTITGGTIVQSPRLATPVPLPTDGTDQVFELTIPGFTPNAAAQVTGLPNNYGLNDVYADADGQIYVYLPNGSGNFNVEGTAYCYAISDAAATAFLASETFDIAFVNANPDKGTLSTPGGSYPGGTRVTVVATPLSEAFVFDKWIGNLPDGVSARSPEISFLTGDGDVTLTAHFVDAIRVNGRSVGYGSGEGWTYADDRLTLLSAGPFVIHGTSTYSRIFVDADCTIVASNLYVSAEEFATPALDCNFHDVALALWSDAPYRNCFYGGPNKAGIAVVSTNIANAAGGAKLTVTALNDAAALYVVGGTYSSGNTSAAAGIGGGANQHAGTIDIRGGTITANAGSQSGNAGSAGIGGGYTGSYHAISISGGTVSATASKEGAAIGTGRSGAKGGVIAISGGRITTSIPASSAYTIGGGYQSSGGTILISGGTVSANAGIGGPSAGAVLTITGGSISQAEKNNPAPTDGSQRVYRVTTTVLDGAAPVRNTKVTVRGPRGYGVNDIYTDANGKLYFYLPNGTRRFYVGDQRYQYTVADAAATAVPISANQTILLLQ